MERGEFPRFYLGGKEGGKETPSYIPVAMAIPYKNDSEVWCEGHGGESSIHTEIELNCHDT
jgi:hypothetical protein